ncbi:hypothetical protein C8Q80DRAFT_1109776 [Daedaleopsis nitida]|nr:hypothetical protein C8Q80DRAFT_1109776 [Daedaleopsis nitida]
MALIKSDLAPGSVLKPWVRLYYGLGLTDAKIAEHCRQHFDTDIYGLSDTSVKRLRNLWGLAKTRKQAHTTATINPYMLALKKDYPSYGTDLMRKALRVQYGIHTSKDLVLTWLRQHEPEAVQARKHRKFKRYRFYAAGLNDFWSFDQHDKWGPRFGLWLHLGAEAASGEIKWLKIWWTSKNPRLVASYYIDAVRMIKGVPLITQSDPGTENFGIANAHTFIRQQLDPALEGTLQHRWMRERMNIKPEMIWSQLARQWKPGFEAKLQMGVDQGWYDPASPLESLVFRWVAIPWLQRELDCWRAQFNLMPRRPSKHKILPNGIPMLIAATPRKYGLQDFKVGVPPELFNAVEQEWAPPTHPVFELVPPAFASRISAFYLDMQSPAVTGDNFWEIYLRLLECFLTHQQENPFDHALQSELATQSQRVGCLSAEPICILPQQRPLRQGDTVIGQGACQNIRLHRVEGGYDDHDRNEGLKALASGDGSEDDDHVFYAVFPSDEEELEEDNPRML